MPLDHPNFLSLDLPKTLVIYGRGADPITTFHNIDFAMDEIPQKLSSNYALISPSSPELRFNSSGWITISPQQLLNVTSTESLFQICQDRILRQTDQFSGLIRLFLNSYFEFLYSNLKKFQNQLEPKKGKSEIFNYKDWIFSAWLPLPQASILLPPDYSQGNPSFAEIDIAFWTQERLIVVIIDNANTQIASKKRKLDFLIEKHPNLSLVTFPKEILRQEKFPIRLFPNSFVYFWRNLSLPQGPCIPDTFLSVSEKYSE